MRQIYTSTLTGYSTPYLQAVQPPPAPAVGFRLRVGEAPGPPTKPLISDFLCQSGAQAGSVSRVMMALSLRTTISDGCRPMFNPRYGVMWSAAVHCLCWEGENSPKAGG